MEKPIIIRRYDKKGCLLSTDCYNREVTPHDFFKGEAISAMVSIFGKDEKKITTLSFERKQFKAKALEPDLMAIYNAGGETRGLEK